MERQTYWGYDVVTNSYYRKDPTEKNGWCARYLRLALEKIGIILPLAPAKDYIKNLPAAGFEEVPLENYKPEPGHIYVIDPNNDKYPNGHISIATYNGGFISDFMEKRTWINKKSHEALASAWPYSLPPDLSKIRVFRHSKLTPHSDDPEIQWRFTDFSYLSANKESSDEKVLYCYTDTKEQFAAHLHNKLNLYSIRQQDTYHKIKALIASTTQMMQLQTEPLQLTASTFGLKSEINCSKSSTVQSSRIFVPALPSRKRKNKKKQEELEKLNEQWHQARKEVLKRNSSMKNGQLDQIAHAKLRRNIMNMYVCIPGVSKHDPIAAFKAARYVFNKLDLFENIETARFKAQILNSMADQIQVLYRQDKILAEQAVKFVFKNAGKSKLRERMRKHITPSPPVLANA